MQASTPTRGGSAENAKGNQGALQSEAALMVPDRVGDHQEVGLVLIELSPAVVLGTDRLVASSWLSMASTASLVKLKTL